MANLILPIAGAAVGYVFGGPTGAQIGYLLGSAVQGSQANKSLKPAQLADLSIQTSEYGTSINRIVGTQRVAGNVIWYGDKKQYTHETGSSGKGGGGQKTYKQGYTVDFAVGICVGPIKGIRRVWSNGNLIIDCSNGSMPLTGQLYLGDETQLPDPTMEAALGAGNVPGYRGLAYIVMNDFDLGMSGALPQLSFEVVKDGAL